MLVLPALVERPLLLFGSGCFEFLKHREHNYAGDCAEHHKNRPVGPEGDVLPEEGGDGAQVVAYSCGGEPAAHHEAFVLGRGDFGDKGDAHRAQEELSKGEHEVGRDKVHRHYGVGGDAADGDELGGGGLALGGEEHDEVAYSGYEHSKAYLLGG